MHYILSEWEPEIVERITGVKKVFIEQAAYIFATSKTGLIWWGLGLVEHRSGSYGAMAAANLATLCGFWGKPGCGAMPLRGHCNVQGACDMGGLPYVLPGYRKTSDPELRKLLEEVWGKAPPEEDGLTLNKMLEKAKKGEFKAFYIMGYDIAMSHSNLKEVWKALENTELNVVQDIFMPFTGKWAHVILPSACVLEKEGTFTNGERRVQYFDKAIDPPGTALPDWVILTKLAQKLGYNWDYKHPSEIAEEIGRVWSAWKGISYDRLKEKGIHWPCPEKDHPGTPLLFTTGFPRKKIRLALSKYLPPEEEPDKEHPFILITGKRLSHFRCGGKTRRVEKLKSLYPYPVIEVNPADAERLGISTGSLVKVKNLRGEVKLKVHVNKRIPQGYLFTDYHFDEAPVNILVGDGADEFTETPEYKVVPVRLEKI